MTESFRVGVIDYEMGNLHSAAKALALHGCDVTVSSDAATLGSSDLLVLPGVGAFGAGMRNLARAGLDDFVRSWILERKRPFLGICIGMQLLFESSEESSEKGLGVLKGRVARFRPGDFKGEEYRIPHMGWNTVSVTPAGRPLYDGLGADDRFYFVHTFFPEPADASIVATTTTYGRTFCSSVVTDRLFATQFHPEKSGDVGRLLLANALARARKEKAGC